MALLYVDANAKAFYDANVASTAERGRRISVVARLLDRLPGGVRIRHVVRLEGDL
jgi:hypothetical protein